MIFEAVAEGRLNLNAVVLLSPHLTLGNSGELLAAAAHMGKPELDRLLAECSVLTQPLGAADTVIPLPTSELTVFQQAARPVEEHILPALEQRVRVAVGFLAPKSRSRGQVMPAQATIGH